MKNPHLILDDVKDEYKNNINLKAVESARLLICQLFEFNPIADYNPVDYAKNGVTLSFNMDEVEVKVFITPK